MQAGTTMRPSPKRTNTCRLALSKCGAYHRSASTWLSEPGYAREGPQLATSLAQFGSCRTITTSQTDIKQKHALLLEEHHVQIRDTEREDDCRPSRNEPYANPLTPRIR